jgi:DNA-binding NarL/FixJ family response regulator
MSVFGLRRLLHAYADRVRVVDRLVEADLVLVDPHLPMSGITDVGDLLESMAVDGVVVYTWASASGASGPSRLRAAGWPLRGWLSKGLTEQTLVDALERIHAGEWVDLDAPEPGHRLQAVPPMGAGPTSLTPREGQIVSLIAGGLTNRQIADQTYLSINSVKTYIRSAYRKMGVSRRTQAVVWAVQRDHDARSQRSAGTDDHG